MHYVNDDRDDLDPIELRLFVVIEAACISHGDLVDIEEVVCNFDFTILEVQKSNLAQRKVYVDEEEVDQEADNVKEDVADHRSQNAEAPKDS